MKRIALLVCTAINILANSVILAQEDSSMFVSYSPVVGVLTQPSPSESKDEYYIAASYVKWLELAGARAIPIPYDASELLVDELFAQVNGLLLPGGSSAVPPAAKRLWELANQADINSDFPIWGTCLGFEYLVQLASDKGVHILQSGFDAENISMPLQLTTAAKNSSLYGSNPRFRSVAASQNVSMHSHHMGVEPGRFMSDAQLSSMFIVTSTNVDRKGRHFVSTIEPRDPDKHPFYGVQYHPEKNAFEYGTVPGSPSQPFESINHSGDAIFFSEYLAQSFGRLLRRNQNQSNEDHSYTDPGRHPLVYDYPMWRTTVFEQVFIIPSADHWENRTSGHERPTGMGQRASGNTHSATRGEYLRWA